MADNDHKLKILHLEDSATDAEFIARVLKKGNVDCDILLTSTKDEFTDALTEFSPDIILSDYSLPTFYSHEPLDILHASGCKIPFILITSVMTDEFAVDAIKRGANDYILKDRLERLPAAIYNLVGKFKLEREQQDNLEQIIQANRLYAFISQINQTIVHVGDEQALFKKVCRIAVEFGKYGGAWIGIYDTDSKRMIVANEYGIPADDMEYYTNVYYEDVLSLEHVLRTGSYYCHDNIQNDPGSSDFKTIAAKRGYKSSIALPIKKGGSVIGAFNLYAPEAKFFSSSEIALLEEAAGDISFALDVFEKEKLKIQAQLKLRHSELRLKQAQEIAHFGNWELSFATGIARWSEEALRIYGLPLSESNQSYESWMSFIHPDDTDYVRQISRQAQQDKKSSAFYHRIIRKDGTVRYLYSQTEIEFDAEGRPLGLYGVIHDVTEMKEIEQALRESESNLHAIFENTSEGFILTDTEGIVKTFNHISRDIIWSNTHREIAVGSSIFEYVHPSRKNAYNNAISRILSGEALQYEYPYERQSGEVKWYNFAVSPAYGITGIEGICISTTDITERKQAEVNLRNSESNLKAVIENTDAAIYSLDRELRYTTFNRQLQNSLKQMYGLDIQLGDDAYSFFEKLEPKEANSWKSVYTRALNGEIVKFEKKFVFNNQPGFVDFSIYPIWENENVIGLSCFGRDITSQKRSEEERERMITDIVERNKRLQQFSYIVSHNLRAPVANILGISEVLKDETLDTDARAPFRQGMLQAVQQIDNVINDLNSILQVKREITEKRENVDLGGLVADIKASISNLIQSSSVSIITDFTEENKILTVKSYLHSIFFNLISNSIKYRRPDVKPLIEIKTIKHPDELIVVFKDNGRGIDLEKKGDQVFGLYKRFHPDIEGKGVGLFMVKTQVETLGGKISVSSEVDKGTEFKIVFDSEL